MTTPESKLDGGLAWDLSEIFDVENIDIPRAKIEGVARKLTEKGYHRGPKGISASFDYIESVGAKLADEFIPVFEALRKRHDKK